jgi:GTP-binding protein EngB required for normal cell division
VDSTLDSIRQAAERLAEIGRDREDIAERARRLAERIRAQAFHLAVLGEFKRGKSTLINALLERPLLPAGVVPVTAVVTEVHYGPPDMVVSYLDGHEESASLERMAEFVTESANPANRLGVARVKVAAEAPLLRPGVVLVDTPGIASVFAHNTEVALEALKDTDGAVVVLSVDSPVSEDDKEILSLLDERGTRIFLVVNKVDHLSRAEVEEVREFMETQVGEILGSSPQVFFVAARAALDSALEGHASGVDSREFPEFRAALESFVQDELVGARLDAAHRELGRLGSELHDSITLEAAASELGLETLKERVEEFRAAAARERRAQEDDQVLLEHAVRELKDRVANRLAAHSEDAPGRSLPRLEAVADSAGKRQMEDLLHGEVEHCVREGFEELRQGEASQADRAWSELAMDFRSRTQTRVDAVRQAASDLFEVHLPTVRIPTVAEERERFFYIFVHIEGLGSGLGRFLRPFLPRRFFKRLALDVARRRLADEFDKHAGQARWDLTQRLEQVQLRFEAAMRIEVEQAEKTILSAATSAEALLCSTMAEQEDQREHRGILDGLARELRSVLDLHE